MTEVWIALGVLFVLGLAALITFTRLVRKGSPNELLIFIGPRRRVGNRVVGYKWIRGGFRMQIPLLEKVEKMDLTNIVIDVSVHNAYSKGGIPLSVQGVANVKIASHEPLLNNAIERFLGKTRQEIMMIAKANLEGSLRGILATMTPEEVNEDKIMFAERLVHEVEQDMTALGLVVDTMKIQNVSDEVNYLDSIGRKKNAEIVARARIAEATAKADSIVRSAENQLKEMDSKIDAEIEIARAEAQRRLADIRTQRDALISEELAKVAAEVAKTRAEIDVQKARVEQVRRKLEADVVTPARATAEAMENKAKADVVSILQDGKARADALRSVAASWEEAGENARTAMLVQKLDTVTSLVGELIASNQIKDFTMIPVSGTPQASNPASWLPVLEQIKQVYGIDVVQKAKELANSGNKVLSTSEEPDGNSRSSVSVPPVIDQSP
jgi:flotillin